MRPDEVPEGPLLLDTTAFSYLLRGSERDRPWQELVGDHSLLIAFVTVGEVLHGALHDGWGETRMAGLEVRLAAVGVIPGTIGVARSYARLRKEFGTSKGANDLWIAACSMAQDPALPIVTGDGDFDTICEFGGMLLVRP